MGGRQKNENCCHNWSGLTGERSRMDRNIMQNELQGGIQV